MEYLIGNLIPRTDLLSGALQACRQVGHLGCLVDNLGDYLTAHADYYD